MWAATQALFTCDLVPKRCAFGQVLALDVLGYDVLRWGGLCILTMLMALAALAARHGPPASVTPVSPGVAAIFAVVPLLLPAPYSHQAGAPPAVQDILRRS